MVTVTISQQQADSNQVDLTEFAGKDLIIYRRGIGYLKAGEYTNINTGGFSLSSSMGAGETFFVWSSSTEIFTTVQAGSTVISQYPHVVKFFKSNWSSESQSLYVHKGRAETGGNAKTGFNQDDLSVLCIVYMPIPIDTVEIGIPVEVYCNNELLASGPVKQFSKGQLNARIWL